MASVTVSGSGRITIPAAMRRQLNIRPGSRVEVEVRETEIVIRPTKSLRELYGIFHEAAKGKTEDWETVRTLTERAVAEEVMRKDLR